MFEFDWLVFLQRWSENVLASPIASSLPDAVRASGWLGFAAATDDQIAEAESRLGIALPPSYKSFLKVSNGFHRTGHAIEHVRGATEIEWFKKKNRDWIKAFTEIPKYGPIDASPDAQYFAYEAPQNFRPMHLKETLQISEIGDSAVYLLNPQVISKDGEWEAWFFANWLPGVHRYRSFLEMMQADYHHFAGIEWKQIVGVIGELPDEYLGFPGTAKRRLKKRRARRGVNVMGRPLEKWSVEELLEMLKVEAWDILWDDVAYALGMLGDDRAIEPLCGLVDRGNITAMHALKKLSPDRLIDSLFKVLHHRQHHAFQAAAHILAELREIRAVPILVALLCDHDPQSFHLAKSAGGMIAAFGQQGFDALVELTTSTEPDIRERAIAGLYYTNRPEVRNLLQQFLNDPDPTIRQNVNMYLKVLR